MSGQANTGDFSWTEDERRAYRMLDECPFCIDGRCNEHCVIQKQCQSNFVRLCAPPCEGGKTFDQWQRWQERLWQQAVRPVKTLLN